MQEIVILGLSIGLVVSLFFSFAFYIKNKRLKRDLLDLEVDFECYKMTVLCKLKEAYDKNAKVKQ